MKKLLLAMTCLVCFSSFALADTVDDAISWMYDNGLTIHNNKADFKATKGLRRDEAAKFYVNFAKLLGNTEYVKTASQCTFSDINNSRSDLKDIVVESCRLGLFQGSNGKFNPTKQLTNAQAITVLVRLLAGNQSEIGLSHRANNYYTKANELGILTSVSMNGKDSTATRGNVGVIIWNGKNFQGSINNNLNTITYNNSTYGFSLELPPSRTGYIVTTSGNAIKVGFIQQSGILTINAISHNEWDDMQNDGMHPTYLGENSNYVFVYSTAQDAVNQTIANKMGKINEIVKTFKNLNGNNSTLSTFSDNEIGVSFSYPSNWGTLTKDSETNNGNKYLIVLLKNGNTFFTFHNGGNPVARGGFWGDGAQNINSTGFVYNFCQAQPNCTMQTNTNGVEYAKYVYEYGEMGSSQTYTGIGYMIFNPNPNSNYRGIIMSNERIPSEPISNLDAIINSLSFL